jgi:hypothetical protein
MEIMLQNAPDNMIHHLTAAQRQIYYDLNDRKSVHNPDSDRIFMKSRRIPIGSDCWIDSPGFIKK